KRLLVAAWCRARREQVELLPALDGHGVDIVFRRTSQLTRGECAELCDFIQAWCAENGVELREARQWVDAETGEVMG
ncbi:MAG: recombination protein NinB, partial [Sphingomonadales bacterium]|nr:recombination protein NinB [Sphingomonadales bacterium]